MKVLHILRSEPDQNTKVFLSAFSKSQELENTVFNFYEEPVDYEKLLDLIFEHEKVISWW